MGVRDSDSGVVAGDSAGGDIQGLNSDVLTRIFKLLDGPSLAAASCTGSHLRAIASRRQLWEDLCLATWPSLRHLPPPNSPAAFFFDVFSFPSPAGRRVSVEPLPAIISAVDLFHKGKPVWSGAVRTDTRGRWFECSPFRVDAVVPGEGLAAPPVSAEGLTLNWVVIEPVQGRAVNLSSRRPVEVERRWYTGEILVRFAVVLNEGKSAAVVVAALAEETMEVRELRLGIEDEEGVPVNGKDSLEVLSAALNGDRRRGDAAEEEAQRDYGAFAQRAAERKERRFKGGGGAAAVRRIAAAASVALLAFLILV